MSYTVKRFHHIEQKDSCFLRYKRLLLNNDSFAETILIKETIWCVVEDVKEALLNEIFKVAFTLYSAVLRRTRTWEPTSYQYLVMEWLTTR